MDKELLKKKLHEQIDAMDDELLLQKLYDIVVEYSKTKEVHADLTSGQVQEPNESLPQSGNTDWISHDDLMELAKTWPQK
jgi:hypothetical protein